MIESSNLIGDPVNPLEKLINVSMALYVDLKETHDEELGKLPLKAKKILLKTMMKKFKKVKFRTLQVFS